NALEPEAGRKFALVFTDGMQNFNPMLVNQPGGLEIRSDPSAVGDSGVPGAPGVPLASRDITVNTIGVGVNGAPYESLLQEMAYQSSGVSFFTDEPDQGLELFFLHELVGSLQGATPRMVRNAASTLSSQGVAVEKFAVNQSATRAAFVLSWDDRLPRRL